MVPATSLLVSVALAAMAADHPPADFRGLQPERVAQGFVFTEGPVWHPDGWLIFSDTRSNRIHKYIPGAGASVLREPSNRTNGNTLDREGRLYHCEVGARRLARTHADGRYEILVDRWQDKRLNSPNDVVVRSDGNVYFTDPAFSTPQAERELEFYGVFHLTPDGQLSLIARYSGRPNGIALSPGGKLLYVANTDDRVILAYDLDGSGTASRERVLISSTDGAPDGLRIDSAGNLYVAATGIEVYSPRGKLLGVIPVPEVPSNCAFGDDDLRTLYITARTSVYRVRVPIPGSVQYLPQRKP